MKAEEAEKTVIKALGLRCSFAGGLPCAVEVERVSMGQMEERRQQYPEAFEREYAPASGLRFNAWVEGGRE